MYASGIAVLHTHISSHVNREMSFPPTPWPHLQMVGKVEQLKNPKWLLSYSPQYLGCTTLKTSKLLAFLWQNAPLVMRGRYGTSNFCIQLSQKITIKFNFKCLIGHQKVSDWWKDYSPLLIKNKVVQVPEWQFIQF